MKRSIPFLILILFSFVTLFAQPKESFANAHPNIKLKDGNATGSNYSPTDVDPAIKNRWEKNNVSDIIVGGKYPRKVYNPNKGNRFGYDIYQGVTSNANKRGLRIEKLNGKDHLAFDGWAVIDGYYHHDRHNQVTYIGAVNVKNTSERKIYKAKMTNLNAYHDLKWNFGSGENKCPNSGSGAFQKYSSECNMEYKWVGFKAYLPLDELFPKNGRENEWRLFIIKGVKGHGSLPSGKHIGGARYVQSPLVMPSHLEKRSWSGQGADVVVRSGTELRYLTMVTSRVYRQISPRSSIGDGYFREHNEYRYLIQDENAGVTTWLGVRSPHDNNKTRYASSMYWDFGGNIATVSLERTHYDIGVEHKDAISGEILLKEKAKPYKRGTRTFNSKKRGYFTTPEKYEYVPLKESKRVKVDRDKTVVFEYKASLPNPSRVVEQSGGKNTHGKGVGEAEWKLDKKDKPEELPDPNSDDFEWRNVTGGVEITKYIGDNQNVNVPDKLDGKNVVSIGDGAFEAKGVASVRLPETVARIRDKAFKDNNLVVFDIPRNVTKIGKEAFMNNNITEVLLPDSVREVGASAFINNDISTLVLGGSLEKIGEFAFAGNQIAVFDSSHSPELKYIENGAFLNNEISTALFNDGLVRIGGYAFTGSVIQNVDLPDTLDEVGSYAFASNLIDYAVVNNNHTQFGQHVFLNNKENPKDVVIFGYVPSTAKAYAEENNHTFRNLYDEYVYIDVEGGVEIIRYNGKDYDLDIPDKLGGKDVVSIGTGAFQDLALSSVKLPKKVHTIKELAFADNELKSIDLSNVKKIKSGAFTRNKLTEVKFNDNLEELAEFAFRSNKLTSVTIPSNITVIERYAFDENELTSVNLHNDITNIKERAFADNKLKIVNLPNKLKTVGELAFWNNELTSVTLNDSLEEIEARAFDSNDLAEIVIENAELEIGYQAFSGNRENAEDFTIRGHCESTASEYAEDYGHTFTDLDGNSCDKYVLATDDDFEFFDSGSTSNSYEWNGKKGNFLYVGTSEYVEIPNEIKDLKMESYYRMFLMTEKLEGVKSTNENIKDMTSMFFGITSDNLDLTKFDTSNVTHMDFMFSNTTISKLDLSPLDTSNVLSVDRMFSGSEIKELDLSSFDMSNISNTTGMFREAKIEKGYAKTQKDADILNNLYGEDIFIVKSKVLYDQNLENAPIKEVKSKNLLGKVKEYFFDPLVVKAKGTLEESKTHLINNFVTTGNHRDVRNVKHTIKVGNHTETDTKPFSIVVEPERTKNKDMEYDFEYEYTNHIKHTYKCTDKKGKDCFKWKLDKSEPAWEEPYVKQFKLSDTTGEFERYTTSRVGRINNANVLIYSSLDDTTGTQAGNSRVGNTYYIKEKAVKGNEARYLISSTSGIIGWVNELDMTTYTHYEMDQTKKTFKLTGAGRGYTVPWGAKNQRKVNLRDYKGKNFKVNLTQTVGDDIWYRGTISGVSGNVWINKKYTTSNEIIQIKETKEVKLNNVTNKNVKLSLEMNHQHDEDIIVKNDNETKIELLVGRKATHSPRSINKRKFEEEIEVDRKDTKLTTQTWKEINNVFKYKSDYDNVFTVIDGDKYYFPNDLDENLKEKYKNKTKYKYSKYAIPLRNSGGTKNALEFASEDNFLVAEKTGFIASLPHDEVSMLVINEEVKKQYEEFTGKKFNDRIISDPFNASKYYVNIDLRGEQKPNTKYADNVVIGKVGLSDITVHLMQELEFEHYLFGHYSDEPIFVEQRDSVIRDMNYMHKIKLTKDDIKKLREIEAEREGNIHSFKPTDYKEFVDKVKEVAPY